MDFRTNAGDHGRPPLGNERFRRAARSLGILRAAREQTPPTPACARWPQAYAPCLDRRHRGRKLIPARSSPDPFFGNNSACRVTIIGPTFPGAPANAPLCGLVHDCDPILDDRPEGQFVRMERECAINGTLPSLTPLVVAPILSRLDYRGGMVDIAVGGASVPNVVDELRCIADKRVCARCHRLGDRCRTANWHGMLFALQSGGVQVNASASDKGCNLVSRYIEP